MREFEKYRDRLGEVALQAIIEKLERYEGIRHNSCAPLEQRWTDLMNSFQSGESLAA